jgi:hypothetical protein
MMRGSNGAWSGTGTTGPMMGGGMMSGDWGEWGGWCGEYSAGGAQVVVAGEVPVQHRRRSASARVQPAAGLDRERR